MIWIKICAITNLPDAQAGRAAGADALGFIFAPSSRRIEIEQAAEIISSLTDDIDKIGVFVNQAPAQVAESGIETGDDIASLRDAGFDAFLIGESLMRAPHPGDALRALLAQAVAAR